MELWQSVLLDEDELYETEEEDEIEPDEIDDSGFEDDLWI